MTEKNSEIKTPLLEAWKCITCKNLLGFVENKEILRIKRKDVFIQVRGGRVSMMCVKCGKPNTLYYDKNTRRKEEE